MTQTPTFESLTDLTSEIVYVRALNAEEIAGLPAEMPEGVAVYAIHDAQGARLALTDNRELAFQVARQHDRLPVSVH